MSARLVALLREHYAVGLFGLDELDRRVGLVLSARYLDEVAAAVADLPGAGWIPAGERFRDPGTRVVMRVWIDPADHSRHYIPEPGGPQPARWSIMPARAGTMEHRAGPRRCRHPRPGHRRTRWPSSS